MIISDSKSKSARERVLPYIYFLMVFIVFALLSIVVMMLLTGSVQVLNERYFHSDYINMVTLAIAAGIATAAVLFFLKNAKKIFRFLEDQVTHRT